MGRNINIIYVDTESMFICLPSHKGPGLALLAGLGLGYQGLRLTWRLLPETMAEVGNC